MDAEMEEGCHDSPAEGAKPILDSDTTLLQNLKGRHVQLYWPDDNKWYDAEVLDFNNRNKAAKYDERPPAPRALSRAAPRRGPPHRGADGDTDPAERARATPG